MGCCGSATGAVATCPEGELWTYTPANGLDIVARDTPKIEGKKTGRRLAPGETFRVTQTKKVGEVTFLRLAGDGGWLFDTMPVVGLVATKAPPDALAPDAREGDTYSPREPGPVPGGTPLPLASTYSPREAVSPALAPVLQKDGQWTDAVVAAPAAQAGGIHWNAMNEEASRSVVDRSMIDHTSANEEQECWSCACAA
jgi:hypothetical protein